MSLDFVKTFLEKTRNDPFRQKALQVGILGARKLLNQLRPVKFPIDLKSVAQFLKIKVYDFNFFEIKNEELRDCKGMTINVSMLPQLFPEKKIEKVMTFFSDCTYITIIKSDLSPAEKRFTLAHEIGHVFLKHLEAREKFVSYVNHLTAFNDIDDECFFDKNYLDNIILKKEKKIIAGQELSANAFAGELLVPKRALQIAINEKKLRDLKILSSVFEVSPTVICIQAGIYGYLEYLLEENRNSSY